MPFNHITDDKEFVLELFKKFDNVTVDIDDNVNRYEHLTLDPSKFQAGINEGNCNSYTCTAYYTEEDLNQLHQTSKNNLSMLGVNIRSLYKNCDAFKDFLHCTEMNFEIIGLVETWLKDKPQDYFKLDGFNLELINS